MDSFKACHNEHQRTIFSEVVNVHFRRFIFLAIVCVTSFSLLAALPAFAFDHSHKLFTVELKKYVKKNGVLYEKWKQKRAGLDRYFKELEAISAEDYASFSEKQRKALWLNVYNALAIRLVLDQYPINGKNANYPASSIRQIPDVWKSASCRMAGKDVSLYVIFHSMMRKDFHDCRSHFAIVPASRGAYPLQPEAFQEARVEQQLDKITRSFMANRENLSADVPSNTIYVSHIFKWFPLDFLSAEGGKIPFPPPADDDVVRNYVMHFLRKDEQEQLKGKQPKIVYKNYDWTLNDALQAVSSSETHFTD